MVRGEFLLHVIFTHCVFETRGLGVYVQLSGWAMGTNAAPTWANLVLRFYESRVPSPSSHVITRFIDDGLVLHHPNVTREQLLHDIQSFYPPTGGGVASGHRPTPSHSRTTFRVGGGGGGWV